MTQARTHSHKYELYFRENPGRLGGWLWQVEVHKYSRKDANAALIDDSYFIKNFWWWAPTRKLAVWFGTRMVVTLRRREYSQEQSWKYLETKTEDELGLARARKSE